MRGSLTWKYSFFWKVEAVIQAWDNLALKYHRYISGWAHAYTAFTFYFLCSYKSTPQIQSLTSCVGRPQSSKKSGSSWSLDPGEDVALRVKAKNLSYYVFIVHSPRKHLFNPIIPSTDGVHLRAPHLHITTTNVNHTSINPDRNVWRMDRDVIIQIR